MNVEEDEGVGYRRVSISSADLINVTNNSIIVLMGRWDLQRMISTTSSSVEIWITSYIMAPFSFNVGLLKYNLLMDVVLGTPTIEHTFQVKMLNVQFSDMRKSFGLSHWNFTPSSHCIIWPLKNKATR